MSAESAAKPGVFELDELIGVVATALAWAQRHLLGRQEQLLAALPRAAGAPLRVALPDGEVVESSLSSLMSPCVYELAELTLELPYRPAELVHRGVRRLGLLLVAPAERSLAKHALQIVVAPGPPLCAELRVDHRRIRGGPVRGVESALSAVAASRPVSRGAFRCILVDERDVALVDALGLTRPAG